MLRDMVMVFTLGLGRSKGDKFDSMGDKPHLLLIQHTQH